ncbi:hypothetical protein EVAR_21081_1 [Eumeta japonica]|uniref:Uncharacterized protein n=1 Tax=Eumeta variegata TaxID=151549 RepID=A0A4C1V194_EUMVA|nr:hypothetical protein EVAR_21081_1 [Eumeta japonica]
MVAQSEDAFYTWDHQGGGASTGRYRASPSSTCALRSLSRSTRRNRFTAKVPNDVTATALPRYSKSAHATPMRRTRGRERGPPSHRALRDDFPVYHI